MAIRNLQNYIAKLYTIFLRHYDSRGDLSMQRYNNNIRIEKTIILPFCIFFIVLFTLTGCAATAGKKSAGVVHSQEATDIWHSYEVLPNYNYYISGAESRPWYIIGIDEKYKLTSKNWKPVDLTPEMLNKWINYYRPRVGYDLKVYGSFILNPDGERVGLWYSMRTWRVTGTVKFGENNQIALTRPVRHWGG